MAPAISSQEITRIPRDPQSAQLLLSLPLLPVKRHTHCSTFRRTSLAHKRRFRYRQFSDNTTALVSTSGVDGTPVPYSPAVDRDSSPFPSADMPATTTVVSDSTPALPDTQARNRVTGITAALIAVCVLVGLAACTMMGRLAYRRRSSLLRRFRRHRQAEDNLGFVFIEYDNSAWGPPDKQMRKDMPSFERSPEAEAVGSSPLTPISTPNAPPLVIEVLPVTGRLLTPPPPTRELDPIVDTKRRDYSNAIPAEDFDSCFKICRSATNSRMEILNALGLAMDSDDNVKQSTLTSSQLAAALALHPGEVDGVVTVECTDSTPSDSLCSDLVACRASESSGSDSELQSVDMDSMDFKRDITVPFEPLGGADCVEDNKSPLDVYNLPRVVVSSSSSVASEVSSCPNRASGVSVTSIDFGDFPRPPFIGDKLSSSSTSLISEIEVSLGQVISGGLGMAGRRVSSASQVTV